MALAQAPAHQEVSNGTLPVIEVRAPRSDAFLPANTQVSNAHPQDSTLNLESQPETSNLDEALTQAGLADWSANSSLGLAQGLNVRGLDIVNQGSNQLQSSRLLLNGHADVAWRFARDVATIERAQVLSGPDATLTGAGSAGGGLAYTSKAPQGQNATRLLINLSPLTGARTMLDIERSAGPLQWRNVLAGQRGGRTVEGAEDARQVGLLSTRLPWATGSVRLDVERHHIAMPFPFGTAYNGERFLYDVGLLDTSRASASRRYQRIGWYVQQALAENTKLHLHYQTVRTSRNELLLGSWGVKNLQFMDGYYRLIDERYQQRDWGLHLQGKWQTDRWQHQWQLLAQEHQATRDFAGPQSIAEYTIDAQNQGYPADLKTLQLKDRSVQENYRERGLGLAWRSDYAGWRLALGLRRADMRAQDSSSAVATKRNTAQAQPLSHSWLLAKQFGHDDGAQQQIWLTRGAGFLLNRGQFADGSYLPASRTTQWEAGWRISNGRKGPREQFLSLGLFDARQTNLRGDDPKNKDYFILQGALRSRGVQAQAQWASGAWRWQANASVQRARMVQLTAGASGDLLAGSPAAYGSIKVVRPLALADDTHAHQAWLRLAAVSRRPGNATGSFYAPGYGIWSVGLQAPDNSAWQYGAQIDNLLDKRYIRALSSADNVWQGTCRGLKVWLERSW